MTAIDRVKEDLDYVASAVRRDERRDGLPAIYFMWSVLVAVGWALPDFAPRWAGLYWLIAAPLGGAASWWLGTRESAKIGVNDAEFGRRSLYHWLWAALALFLVFLPALFGKTSGAVAAINVMLVIGLTYTLAGVHLERPLLWSGLLVFIGYVALSLLTVPYIWTTTGLIVAASLVLAGVTRRGREAVAA